MSELRFECTACGKCCTAHDGYAHVYLNAEEVEDLAAHLGLGEAEFRRRYTFRDEYGWTQLHVSEGRCVFLGADGKLCSVYAVRPAQCRTFPFWPAHIRDGEWTPEVRKLCEGVGRGRLYSIQEVEARVRELEEAEED